MALLLSVPFQVSAEQIGATYGSRWEHETDLDELKTHLLDRTTVNRPVFFRSKIPPRVEQELYGAVPIGAVKLGSKLGQGDLFPWTKELNTVS